MLLRRTFPLLLLLAPMTAGLAADRPNIVWLISEDNSKHYLKMFDEHGAETPAIQELALHGVQYNHAFSNSPVCSVARTTLMTGSYAPRIGTQYHRGMVRVPLPTGLRMFPAYLRDAGYYTTNRQKKDYNAIEGDGVWDASSRMASWRHRQTGQPFFHMQSFGTTHESSLHFKSNVMQDQKTTTNPASVKIAPYHPDSPTFRYTYARYHDRIRQVDQEVGKVVRQLAEEGLLEDTFVFYFGDHGGVLPRSKGYAYESGVHVPLVIRIPNKWKHLSDTRIGSQVPGFVSFIDFGPTVLNLAGVKVPKTMDGRPFLGRDVTAADVNKRDEAFCYADRFDEKYDLVRTVRKGRFKYVRSYQPFNLDGLHNNYRYNMLAYAEWRKLYQAGQLNSVQRQFFEARSAESLFDVQQDPHETNNLAEEPRHAEKLAELRNILTRQVKSWPDLSFYPESVLVAEAFDNPTKFGGDHKSQIARLIDTADLSLVTYDKARKRIQQALESSDPWQRYWGLIACSSHGTAAKPFVEKAKQMAKSDNQLLVRVRAAEFLGLIGAADPRPTIMDVLSQTESAVEANLTLNSLVLLRDGRPGYDFQISANDLRPSVRQTHSYFVACSI